MKKPFKKYLPWIILLIIVLSLSVWYLISKRVTDEQVSEYDLKMQNATAHIEARQYSSAMEKYYEAVDLIPSRVDAYEGILAVLISKNRVKDAVDIVEKSTKVVNSQDRSRLYKTLGDAKFVEESYGEAFDLYDSGLILGVNNPELELAWGKSMLKLGDLDGAKQQFNKNGYEGDSQQEAILLLSYIYALKDISKAKDTLSSLEPSGKRGVYLEEFEEVLDSLGEDEKFNASKLARVFLNSGYPYLAISVLEPVKDGIEEYLEGMYFLGRAYYEFGKYDEAIGVLDQAITLGGLESDILWTKARTFFQKKDLQNSFKSYDGALGYAGLAVSKDLVLEYVNILLNENQALKAEEIVKGLLYSNPEEAYLNFLAVKVYSDLKEEVKVEFYLTELDVMELSGELYEEYLLAKIEVLFGKGESIEEELTKLLEVNKFSPEYYLYLGKSKISDDPAFAKQSLEKAVEYDLNYTVTDEANKLLSSIR